MAFMNELNSLAYSNNIYLVELTHSRVRRVRDRAGTYTIQIETVSLPFVLMNGQGVAVA